MPVKVHVRTEERSDASFPVKPVEEFFALALREQQEAGFKAGVR